MKITRENYETYVIDLIDGNLSAVQEEELMTFLANNPDLAFDSDCNEIKIPVEDGLFSLKEGIKKGGTGNEINEENYGQFCIARMEKDLSSQMEFILEQFLAENPHLNNSAASYKSLVLRPDLSVSFKGKQLLKKKQKNVISLNKRSVYRGISVAASIALLVSSYLFINDYLDPGFKEPAGQQTVGNEQSGSGSEFSREETEPMTELVTEINIDNSKIIISNQYNQSIQVKIETDQKPVRREPVLIPLVNTRHTPGYIKVRSGIPAEPVNPVHLMIQPVNSMNEKNQDKNTGRILLNGLFALFTRDVDFETVSERERLRIWDVADAGFRAINSLAGTDLHLARDHDDNMEVISLGLPSRVIELRRLLPDED
jgi:hypothetical protein